MHGGGLQYVTVCLTNATVITHDNISIQNYNFQTLNYVVTAKGGRGGEIKYVIVHNRTTNRETQSQCLPELCRAC